MARGIPIPFCAGTARPPARRESSGPGGSLPKRAGRGTDEVGGQSAAALPWTWRSRFETTMDAASRSPEEAFWYSLIDYERKQPRASDLKLDRMRALLRHVGSPHRTLRVVHIA